MRVWSSVSREREKEVGRCAKASAMTSSVFDCASSSVRRVGWRMRRAGGMAAARIATVEVLYLNKYPFLPRLSRSSDA